MKFLRFRALFMAMLLFPVLAWAQAGQFYFVARTAPEASLSGATTNPTVVYLRWDTLEGQLPSDVERLRLLRDGQPILDINADATMPAAQISQLYQGPNQKRRLLETVSRLKEYAISENRDFNTSQFALELKNRLENDPLWAFLASRTDFNVARARYRGLIDQPGPGQFQYELLAVNGEGVTARLGKTLVDTGSASEILPPQNFRQVLQARCDLPEYAKDHHTVALAWNAPGANNITDRVASQLFISGYDLYRTTSNVAASVTSAPPRDLDTESAGASYDSRGDLQISGLEKVNDQLLTVTPDGSDAPEWLETYNQLSQDGLEPGDRRAYYLVARDFTGNYGNITSGIIVQIPNLVRPPTPWDVSLFASEEPKEMAITFDKVNLENYLATYRQSRRICNLAEAPSSGVLKFVGPDEDCSTDTQREVRLDVSGYKVYRFEEFERASSFLDSDGDGVANSVERPAGTQCDASRQPTGAASYLIDAQAVGLQEQALPNSGRLRMSLRDKEPGQNRGGVYWYRIAAQTDDRQLSLLTPPVRALFPDRDLPPKPTVNVSRPGTVLEGCAVTSEPAAQWGFNDNIGEYNSVALTCGGETVSGTTKDFTSTTGSICTSAQAKFCDGATGRTLSYPASASDGAFSCTAQIPDSADICGASELTLEPSFAEGQVAVADPGLVPGPVTVEVTAPDADTCVSLYREIDGEAARVATSCGAPSSGSVEYVAESGFFCGYAVAHDQNNNISVPEVLPCTLVDQPVVKTPGTPQPVSFRVGDSQAFFSWRLPVERVAVTMARIVREKVDGQRETQVVTVPVPGVGSGDVQSHRLPVPVLQDAEDRWCLSLRSIGPGSDGANPNASGWSSPRCTTRTAAGPQSPPEYLPWPKIAPPPEGEALTVHQGAELFTQGRLGLEGFMLFIDLVDVYDLRRECYIDDIDPISNFRRVFVGLECNRAGLVKARGAVMPALDFLVYRQRRNSSGELQEWIQVSPLIEYAHWDDITPEDPEAVKKNAIARLNDPYIKVHERFDTTDSWRFVYLDRYPYIDNQDYRFRFVYFTDDHRIDAVRETGWITASSDAFQGSLSDSSGEGSQ